MRLKLSRLMDSLNLAEQQATKGLPSLDLLEMTEFLTGIFYGSGVVGNREKPEFVWTWWQISQAPISPHQFDQ